MPTATSTLIRTAYSTHIPIKTGVKPPPTPSGPSSTAPSPSTFTNGTSTSATLRSLYNRAARAFLHRDIPLTHTLIESAFQLLKPPVPVNDASHEHRRKWDILRITLETTVYADPPALDTLPQALKANLTESPQALMTSIYTRSLSLFTPSNGPAQKSVPNAAYLPPAVLITLLYSSLKVDCPDIGRMMAEQWFSRRELPSLSGSDADSDSDSEEGGYDKVVEIYTLHLLPKLGQWDRAKEFLQFEGELSGVKKQFLQSRLSILQAEDLASRKSKPLPPPSPSSTPTPRSHSPAPSSSSSSSLSTTSTHTVVPSTPRGSRSSGLQQFTPISSTSTSPSPSDGTITPRKTRSRLPNGQERSRSQGQPTDSSTASSSSASSSVPRINLQATSVTPVSPSIYSLIKAFLAPHLTTSKVTTFLILFVIFPWVSWVLRIRHRRNKALAAGGAGGLGNSVTAPTNVDLVRRRLQAAGASDANIFLRLGREAFRAVTDTVKMAGSGLV